MAAPTDNITMVDGEHPSMAAWAARPLPPRRAAAPPSPARLPPRALALLLDGLLLMVLSLPPMWLAYREPIARLDDLRPLSLALNWLLPAFYFIGFWTWQGATPGKLVAGVRVVDAHSGARPSRGQSALRCLGYLLSALPLGLGFLWAGLDRDKRAWHDRLAGTRVVPRRRQAVGDGPELGYLAQHWRGEQSLAQSFWVNNVLLSVPLAMALTGLMSWIGLKGEALQAGSIAMLIGWPLMLAVDAWCIVGAWRAARAYRRMDGSALWANLARLCLIVGALQTLASALIGFAPQLGEYWQLARGVDPIGQARLTLSADGRSLRLEGPIGMGDATRLQRLLAGAPQPVHLFELASPGGRLHEAERMVEQVRKAGADTRAVGDCASACTLVFLAGGQRQLMPGAQLGFHRASSGSYNPVFDALVNQELAATYRRIGLPEPFIQRTLRTPPDDMWWPRSEDLVAHALIAAPPQTLDVPLPGATAGTPAPAGDYVEVLRANPAWYQLDKRFPGLVDTAAAGMQAARAAQASDDEMQTAALRVLAAQLPALIVALPPELRRSYLGLLGAKLRAARAAGPAHCQALLTGQLSERRQMPIALRTQETRWLMAAAEAPPARWLPKPPSSLELEVVRRTLGGHAPGMLSGVWTEAVAGRPAPASCDAVIRTLDRAATLPVAQRELAQRLVFQGRDG